MDHFVERERVKAMKVICRAYRPSAPLSFVAKELGFVSDEEEGGSQSNGMEERRAREECWNWLVGKGTPFVDDRGGRAGPGGVRIYPTGTLASEGMLEGGFVDGKTALPVFTEHLRNVVARGVDLKGQIH